MSSRCWPVARAMAHAYGPSVAGVVSALGKGKIAALFGPAGTTFYRTLAPWLGKLLGSVASQLHRPTVKVSVAPHVKLDVSIRRRPGAIVVHLVNVTLRATASSGESERYHFVEALPPTGPVMLTMALNEKPLAAIVEPDGGAPLTVSGSPGAWRVIVPEVGIHSAVVLHVA
jgi:hypothetical protein